MKTCYFDVTNQDVLNVADAMRAIGKDEFVMAIIPLSGSIEMAGPAKKGKYKGLHRIKCELLIPEEAIVGDAALTDFKATVLMAIPNSRVAESMRRKDEA